jgi:hypothetical protein
MSRPSRLPISGSLVAALLLVGGASAARASCGHYIGATPRADGAPAIGFERLHLAGALIDTARDLGPTRTPASPCGGLGCSPDRPFPVPTPPAEPRVDLWGCLDAPPARPCAPSLPLPPDDDGPTPTDRADRLARPPR